MLQYLRKLVNRDDTVKPSPKPVTCYSFSSKEEAEAFFSSELQKDLNRIKALQVGFQYLKLDLSSESLRRLEKFYYQNFVLKTYEIGISKSGLEELVTLYMRQVMVYHGLATWHTTNCETRSGYYESAIMLRNGNVLNRQFGWELSNHAYNPGKSRLVEEYLDYAMMAQAI